MLSTKDMFFYTAQLLNRFAGLFPGDCREDFGYRGGQSSPNTSGLEPQGTLDHGYVVDRFGQEIIDDGRTVVVDVACHSGNRFTSDFAKLKPKATIYGIEISFGPENFNGDEAVGGRQFKSREEVLSYLGGLYKHLGNLILEEACFDLRYPLGLKYNGGQRVLTGFRIPGIVGSDLIEQAVDVGVDLLLTVPMNLAEIKDKRGEYLDDKDPRFRRFGYNFPISEHARRFCLNDRMLHRAIKAPVKRVKDGGRFVPEAPRDQHNSIISKLAKQLVCLDRCLKLEEFGMKTELWGYTDYDHGPYAPDHLIVARKS